MREAVVAVGNLSRRFGARTVLNGVSFEVPHGSVFGPWARMARAKPP